MPTLIILVITLAITYYGLSNRDFFNRYALEVQPVLVNKQWDRLISSGFLHVDWIHFALNMYIFYMLGSQLETILGNVQFLFLYFGSMLCGGLLSIWQNRQNAGYRAVGASGAVLGVIFAYILYFPQSQFYFIIIPMKGWMLGLFYIIYSIYGMESKRDNIGHDAHLGGALGGMLIMALIDFRLIIDQWQLVLLILLPVLLYIVYKSFNSRANPSFLSFGKKKRGFETIDDKFNAEKLSKQKELDQLLDKVHQHGYNSLSQSKKEKLDQLSNP